MADRTLHVYFRQAVRVADDRAWETVRQVTPLTVGPSVVLRYLDSPVENTDLQRWNDDGGHAWAEARRLRRRLIRIPDDQLYIATPLTP